MRSLIIIASGVLVFMLGCEEPSTTTPTTPPTSGPRVVADPNDWCGAHGLPESKCTKCNPELIEPAIVSGDWCPEHGFPESVCPQCNPMEPPEGLAGHADRTVGVVGDWCGGHGLPESKCTKCNPELKASFVESGDWCEEHSFPESACPQCNPMSPPRGLESLGDWCLEHALPESKCTLCNPELTEGFRASGDWCDEHGFPESACPRCNPVEPPEGAERAAIEARVVRLRSPAHEVVVGIEVEPVVEALAVTRVDCAAQIAFDQDRLADVRAMTPGVVHAVHVGYGQRVEAGEPLFELRSPDVGSVQASLRGARQRVETARQNVSRKKVLVEHGATSEREVELAEQEYAEARSALKGAESTLKLIGAESGTSGAFVVSAPISGVVVRRPAILGMFAEAESSLATLADPSVKWALCDVPESFASKVAVGMSMELRFDDPDEEPMTGAVTWLDMEVDPRSRTVTARAEIDDPEGKLRANQFARARILTGARSHAVLVPRSALQRVGERDVVFVRTGEGIYAPRLVKRSPAGASGDGRRVAVEGELDVGEQVVTTGAVVLRTELLPGSIGAGCCEPGGE